MFLFVLTYQINVIFFTYLAQIVSKLWDWNDPWWDIKWKDFWFKWDEFHTLSGTTHQSYYKNPWQALLGKVQYIN